MLLHDTGYGLKVKRKIDMLKKGMLFTLGIFLVMIVLLSLVLVSYTSFKELTLRLGEAGGADRFYDLFFSVEFMVKEVFDLYSDIDVWIIKNPDGTTDVGFKEYIGKGIDDYAAGFEDKINALKEYVEQDSNIYLDISALDLGQKKNKVFPLLVLPHNISYLHDASTGQVYLRIEPASAPNFNFSRYNLIVDTETVLIDPS